MRLFVDPATRSVACIIILPGIVLPLARILIHRRSASSALRRRLSFRRHTHGLRAVVGEQVIFRYRPGLERRIDLPALLSEADKHFRELEHFFGSGPWLGLTVVLLPGEAVKEIYGRRVGGFAGSPVVVAADSADFLSETICHEFVHRFAKRCLGQWSCPVLDEGLAVWLTKTVHGVPVDLCALAACRRRGLHLSAVLRYSAFHDPRWEHDCYILAASFTGFLMRRLGTKGFWRFCHRTAIWGYRRSIKRSLGMSLEQAEARWRAELELTELLRGRMKQEI